MQERIFAAALFATACAQSAPASLKRIDQLVVREGGAIVRDLDVQGELGVAANDVTVENCRVRTFRSSGYHGLTVRHVEVGGGGDEVGMTIVSDRDMPTSNFVEYADVHHVTTGIVAHGVTIK